MNKSGDRLARSRMAIIDHIRHKEDRGPARRRGAAPGTRPGAGRLDSLLAALRGWWRRHPVSMAMDFATPTLSSYAGRKPVQFLGIAAALGAVAMLAKPWKLISLTGLVVALVKTSQLSSLVASAMSATGFEGDDAAQR